jgi:hypothetical protein
VRHFASVIRLRLLLHFDCVKIWVLATQTKEVIIRKGIAQSLLCWVDTRLILQCANKNEIAPLIEYRSTNDGSSVAIRFESVQASPLLPDSGFTFSHRV